MRTLSPAWAGRLLLTLFIISGFAGLIYQSVWSQYLGLTLGHAAYAQTLVLSIFMGGMALGAWFVSRKTPNWRRLVMGYAFVELLIGIVGLSFQGIFQTYTRISQENILPLLDSEGIAHAYQWATAALLILPQSLLLGATFPLLSAGYLRIAPRQDGEILGGLYFTNSLGAALGALVATFLLLPAFGLPGTVMTAGGLNIVVGLGAWLVSAGMREGAQAAPVSPSLSLSLSSPRVAPATNDPARDEEVRRLGKVMLLSTAISGATSFVYELGWVRMLNQALGSSIHSFELMLTAFILGLAFGGLWIRRRSRQIDDPVCYVAYVQVLMGIAALLSIPVFARSFHWVGWMMEGLAQTDNGYTLFELGTAVISLAVMFPAAFFAGMTLPLFTMALLRAGADERAIGRIYAANTLGAILGVVMMVHVLIPAIGVKLGLTLAALVDVVLGLYLLRVLSPARMTPGVATAAAGMVIAMGVSLKLGQVDPAVQAAGVFRTGQVRFGGDASVPFLKDGKTATVAIYTYKNTHKTGIATNGKPDAGMTPFDQPPTLDESTMIMLGIMPLVAHPSPKDVALIGWGSGLSTHTVLGSSIPRRVDTIEIEKVMYDAARAFGPRVERAYTDPRSQVRIDDARTFFSTGQRQYDAIVSEPSNPWVSGVANLFTVEFYRFLKRHLKEEGILVQWLHTYEINDPLVATMLAALVSEFPNAELYTVDGGADLLILAPKGRLATPFLDAPWNEAALVAELRRVGFGSLNDIALRRIGGGEVIRQYARLFGAQAHSDYYPEVSLNAPRTRFQNQSATFLYDLASNGLPVLDILDCRVPSGAKAQVINSAHSFSKRRFLALQVIDAIRQGRTSAEFKRNLPQDAQDISHALSVMQQASSDTPVQIREWSAALSMLAEFSIGALPAEDLQGIWQPAPDWLPANVLRTPLAAALMRSYAATAARDPHVMLREAEAVLSLPDANNLAPMTREHLLVIAMLGALGSGDPRKAADLNLRHTDHIANHLATVRSYLLAWADSGVSACVARK
ncbi:MAG: spermine synthase [Candidatus Accumulibacter sp.]|jgi:predicted membrane-bound spermidine synthase|nr:spermine synthase [Accumulibacter sp.]